MNTPQSVWVFVGEGATFPSAVFTEFVIAKKWIQHYSLTGTLTEYPLNRSAYNWAISEGFFSPKKEQHTSPAFIAGFSSAHQKHYHYENGENR